jgi:hypothetical protein
MKFFFIPLLTIILSAPLVQAMDYTVTVKGGWGESRLNRDFTLNNEAFSDEGHTLASGAGLAFDNNIVTGLEFSTFDSDSFFGAHDRIDFSEFKWYLGYRFDIAPHFRITPAAGISRWTLRAKDGATDFDEELRTGTYRDNDAFAQLNIEFPINSLITVVSSLNYTKYEFGVIRSAQAGVIFQF